MRGILTELLVGTEGEVLELELLWDCFQEVVTCFTEREDEITTDEGIAMVTESCTKVIGAMIEAGQAEVVRGTKWDGRVLQSHGLREQ